MELISCSSKFVTQIRFWPGRAYKQEMQVIQAFRHKCILFRKSLSSSGFFTQLRPAATCIKTLLSCYFMVTAELCETGRNISVVGEARPFCQLWTTAGEAVDSLAEHQFENINR